MTRHPRRSRVGAVVILAIATLIAAQPLGVFWHLAEDHMTDHSDAAHTAAGIHLDDAHAAHHDADHGHVWMIPVAAAITPQVSLPQTIAAVGVHEVPSHPSPAPLPPYSPPRA